MMNEDIKETFPPLDQYEELNGKFGSFYVLWDGTMSECKECGSKIAWGMSRKRKFIPFEPGLGHAHWEDCGPNAKTSGVDEL